MKGGILFTKLQFYMNTSISSGVNENITGKYFLFYLGNLILAISIIEVGWVGSTNYRRVAHG